MLACSIDLMVSRKMHSAIAMKKTYGNFHCNKPRAQLNVMVFSATHDCTLMFSKNMCGMQLQTMRAAKMPGAKLGKL